MFLKIDLKRVMEKFTFPVSTKKRTVMIGSCVLGVTLIATAVVLISRDGAMRRDAQQDGARLRRDVDQQTQQTAPGAAATASVYTRWGRRNCPNGAQIVYRGIVGGGGISEEGNGANYLCMPHDPVLGPQISTADRYNAHLYGTEYYQIDAAFGVQLESEDIPCVVCKIPRPVSIMVPAKDVCPAGWEREYSGYLVAAYYLHTGKTEFVCLDNDPHKVESGKERKNGAYMAKVIAKCGSLPCPFYQERHALTCAVCSI